MYRQGWLLVATAILAACGGNPAGPVNEPAYDFSFADPAGDTTEFTEPDVVPKGIDLVKVSGSVDPDEVRLTLEFAEPVSPWSAGTDTALDGFVDFDADENRSTGIRDAGEEAGGSFELGADFYLDLRDNGSGRMALVDAAKRTFSWVKAAFNGTTVEVTIPRSALVIGTDADNRFFLGVMVTTKGRPVTDVAPNESHYLVEPDA